MTPKGFARFAGKPSEKKSNRSVIKGLVFDIRRFSVHDGPGIRTTVFLKGCPLDCSWCHNPEGRSTSPEKIPGKLVFEGKEYAREEIAGTMMDAEEVVQEVLKDRIFYETSGGGVTLSGGEPTFQAVFSLDILSRLKRTGIFTAIDTCGYTDHENMIKFADVTDLFLYDIKLMDEQAHIRHTGISNGTILSNLKFLTDSGKHVMIRYPVIPGINDNVGNLTSLSSFLLSLKNPPQEIHLLPYHALGASKYARLGRKNPMPEQFGISQEKLMSMSEQLQQKGFKVRVGG
ncbi:MAG: glycyl-radical enzyme activating protein [Bacteroidetes bacterium]|nr:glycyl-radical enzyme activating protein [Bacteroidota bacterium]